MEGIFFEIEFMDGVKRTIDSRAVLQWHYGADTNRIVPDGWGCCMEYFVSSLSLGKAIVICNDWRAGTCHEENEVINAVNIRIIKSV